jgi:hypothetical protein
MAQKMTRNDLCSGFREGIEAPQGRCRCGLYWEHKMPPHLSSGEVLSCELYARIVRREHEAAEAEARSRKLKEEGAAKQLRDLEHLRAILRRERTRS